MSLSVDYLNKLGSDQFLIGPPGRWSYHRGLWSGPYEGIRTMARDRGPFALWTGQLFSNGVLTAKIMLHTACESAGLLIRGSVKDDELRGYEFAFEPREQRVVLRRHMTNGMYILR